MDLDKVISLGRSRPRNNQHTVSFFICTADRNRLRCICSFLGVSQSNLLRAVVAEFLDEYEFMDDLAQLPDQEAK